MPLSLPILAASSAAALAAAAAVTAYGVSQQTSQFFGPTLIAPPLPTQLALTFDDGPNPAATPQLLELLARHNVRATFFLIGRFVLAAPALTRQIAAAGHTIGNHTMTHPFLPRRSPARILAELADCNHALEDTLCAPVTLFRPPHGARSPAVFRAARSLSLTTVQWNLIVQDWKPVPAEIIAHRIACGIARNQRHRRGTCVVLHDGGQAGLDQPRLPTVQAVRQILEQHPEQHPEQRPQLTCVRPPDWS